MGSGDPNYCMLISLAVYLETWLIAGAGTTSALLFGDDKSSSKTADKCKKRYQKRLHNIFKSKEYLSKFKGVTELGSHSIRKYPATYAYAYNFTLDDVEI